MARYAFILGLCLLFNFTQAHAQNSLLKPAQLPEYTDQAGRAELRFQLQARVNPTADLTPFVQVTHQGERVEFGVSLSDGLLTLSGLRANHEYQVRLRPGFPLDPNPLQQPFQVTGTTSGLRPNLEFVGDTSLLIVPAGQRPRIAFKAARYNALLLRADVILPAVAMRLLQSTQLSDDPYLSQDQFKQGDPFEKQILLGPEGDARGAVDLSQLNLPASGAYRVSIQGCEIWPCQNLGDQDTAVVLQSHHAINVMWGDQYAWVSLRDFTTGELQTRGQVRVHARNSEVLGDFAIASDGYAKIPAALLKGDGGQQPGLLVAQVDQYPSYLSLNEPPLVLDELDVKGVEPATSGLGYLRVERGVYRPGERVHFASILRDAQMDPMADQAMTLRVIRPDSKVLIDLPVRSDQNGVLSESLDLGVTAKRGRYQAQLRLADMTVTQTQFQVQDFIPETMQIAHSVVPDFVSGGESLSIATQSDFLFGAPASGRPIQASLRAQPTRTPFVQFPDFQFGGLNTQDRQSQLLQALQLTTADDGSAEFEFTPDQLKPIADATVPQRLLLDFELTELSGRITRLRTHSVLATQPRWIGVKPVTPARWYPIDSAPQMSVVSVDALSGQAKAGRIRWRLVEEDWDYYWRKQGSRWSWRVEYFERAVIASGQLDVSATGAALRLPKLGYGRYKLQLLPAAGQPTEQRLSVGWWGTGGANAAVPDTLDVVLSNATPAPNESVQVSVRAPFDGTAEVWVLGQGTAQIHQMELHDREGQLSITTPADLSQAYILVKGFRAASAVLPGPARAVGVAHLNIAPDRFERRATIHVPPSIRPNSELTFDVEVPGARDGASVVVSMVDVGILNLTRHPSASPVDWFTRKQALGVELFDPYGFVARLLSDIAGNNLVVGGDQAGDAAQAQGQFFETIAVQTPALSVMDGRVKVRLPVGELNGRVRIDVMGSDGRRSIQGSAQLTVRDPIAVTSSIPRVAAAGDQIIAGVGVTAIQTINAPVTLRWGIEGVAADLTTADQSIDQLVPGRSIQMAVPIRLLENGDAAITLTLQTQGHPDQRYRWPIQVRAPGSLAMLQRRFSLPAGERLDLPMQLLDQLENSSASLSVSRLPLPDTHALLASLSRYPYGCLEQTVSKAWPLAIIESEQARAADLVQARSRLNQSYQRIADLQRASGQFSLWNSSHSAETWLSLYAMDFLAQPTPTGIFNAEQTQHIERLRLRTLNDAQGTLVRLSRSNDADIRAYALLLRVQAGQPDVGEMRYLLSSNELDPTSAAQLAYGFHLLGDTARSQQAFELAAQLKSDRVDYETYSSPLRDSAARAYYAAISQQWAYATAALDQMNTQASNKSRLSTQERAWVARAVMAAQSVASVEPAAWSLSNPALDSSASVENRSDQPLHIALSVLGHRVAGQPASEPQARWWAQLSSDPSGVSVTQEIVVLDAQLNLKATYPAGTTRIDVQQGDLLLLGSETTVRDATYEGEWLFEQKAAGGLEIENPNLGGLAVRQVLSDLGVRFDFTEPTHESFLDDRHAAMGYLSAGENGKQAQTLSLWRAVTPGQYRLPGAHVENMLNPSLTAATDERVIHVQAR